jgi:Right handed beta helix region
VNTTADPGTSTQCSLRAAINNANSKTSSTDSICAKGTGTDTIIFGVSGTIRLGSSLPAIQNTLTISGSGRTITVDGASSFQALTVNPRATLNLNYLTIAHGNGDFGGGVFSQGGKLTATNCTFSGNSTTDGGEGGGIYIQGGTLTITNCTFSGNTAPGGGFGGGVSNEGGTLTVTNCTFSGNTAPVGGEGGGVYTQGGALTVTNCTFSGNSAIGGGFGGGISNEGSKSTVINSTFSGNSAPGGGEGGGVYSFGTLTVTDSTFSGNGASGGGEGGGVFNQGGTLTVTNSILAKSTSGGDCGFVFSIANGGYNISDDASCGFPSSIGANGDKLGDSVNPLLATAGLQANGGPTETIALQAASPAIGAIPLAHCTVRTDQRGDPRPAPGHDACDVGAYEYQ